MMGAIIGDIVGSRFEKNNHLSKDFDFFTKDNHFTDDTILTMAIANALLNTKTDLSDLATNIKNNMLQIGRNYPNAGWGEGFAHWLFEDPSPYESYGNGCAMRVSAIPYVSLTLSEALEMTDVSVNITHNNPESIKGARAVTECIWMAKHGKNKEEIRNAVNKKYYELNQTSDDYRKNPIFDTSCMHTVPIAIECFLEGKNFEDVIRLAVSVGGDSDTIAAMAGSIAEPYYGIDYFMRIQAYTYLDSELAKILNKFEQYYPSNIL